MITLDEVREIIGFTVYDTAGNKIGSVGQVYLDQATGRPEWLTVRTGLFGTKESFVPLTMAQVRSEGHAVDLSVDKDAVTGAPRVDADQELSEDEEAQLYQHYGLSYGEETSPTGLPEGAGMHAGAGGATGTTGEDAMTRSEERVRVGTTTEPIGRARLRKYVVTEPVNMTVQVTREEARIEREPITEANRDAAMSGPDITEAEHEVTLHAETPVVQKETVPVERVRLTTDEVTEEETVAEEVRKERISAEGDIAEGDTTDRPER
ncbi:MAG TPA: PRC and DUF2382 domain-containing protein [Kineosporiaceae bacterium]|nr:PRC and DUF2382 domain-containing protein [Kineosporiaceae bacterium]